MPSGIDSTLVPLRIGTKIFDFSRTYVMGIVNSTPDSFYDGGSFLYPDKCLRHIEQLIKDGADFIDLGAESTRPGAEPVSVSEEIRRLKPIIGPYKNHFDVPLSLDTSKVDVAEAGLALGADMINDISAFSDIKMVEVVAEAQCPVIVMHMQGSPQTMQQNPQYNDVVHDVYDFLHERMSYAYQRGVRFFIVDPGIGFGKTLQHNLKLLNSLHVFQNFKCPILVGTSNKSFIGEITQDSTPRRLEGTISSNIMAITKGANILRVHDVKSVQKAVKVADAIRGASL